MRGLIHHTINDFRSQDVQTGYMDIIVHLSAAWIVRIQPIVTK